MVLNKKDIKWSSGDVGVVVNDLPEAVIEGNKNNPASVALAVTGLIARPTFGKLLVLLPRLELFMIGFKNVFVIMHNCYLLEKNKIIIIVFAHK